MVHLVPVRSVGRLRIAAIGAGGHLSATVLGDALHLGILLAVLGGDAAARGTVSQGWKMRPGLGVLGGLRGLLLLLVAI